MIRKIVLTLIISLNSVLIFSQSLKLETKTFKDSINFKVTITNDNNQSLVFYKPNSNDLCNGILNFLFKDENGKFLEFYPCEELSQIDSIILNDKNSQELSQGESFSFDMTFVFLQYLKDTKLVRCQIDYTDIEFGIRNSIDKGKVFKGLLKTSFEIIKSN